SHIAKETFDGVGGLNVTMHDLASTHKTSRDVLRPQPGFAPLQDSAEHTWRFSAANWVNASDCVGCSQIPTSSACTSPRSRLGIAASTLRGLWTRQRWRGV